MKYSMLILTAFACSLDQKVAEDVRILPPEELYGDFFYQIQERTDLFPDSKTFVDCIPKRPIHKIRSDYAQMEGKEDPETVLAFIRANFDVPGYQGDESVNTSSTPSEHIENLWESLERPSDKTRTGTLIPLPKSYIVPGGRFREVYYWDSYFTMLGLQVDNKTELIDNVLFNFSNLIDSLGFIPNGNRTYYNSRSQPPFYALMVDLHVTENKTRTLDDYLPYLLKEYDFWMAGANDLSPDVPAIRRVVRLEEGEVLNRYWDDNSTPRAESYREDVGTVAEAVKKDPGKDKKESYRHLRAAAESGWDFSTRWFEIDEDGEFDLSSIHTTDIIPVDLNSLLFYIEKLIAQAYDDSHQHEQSALWEDRADRRKALILKYCWNEEHGFFMDYDFGKAKHTSVKSLAGMYPLFFEIATTDQAERVANHIRKSFLMPGGVVTTLNDSGQQWDYPNGWAPLQWMTIKGLRNYDNVELANEIKERWLALNTRVFETTGKMTEKYNVADLSLEGGGGEYPNQDGFGWTNGVFQKLTKE